MQTGIWTHVGAPSMEDAVAAVPNMLATLKAQQETKTDLPVKMQGVEVVTGDDSLGFRYEGQYMPMGSSADTLCHYLGIPGSWIDRLLEDGQADLAGQTLGRYIHRAVREKPEMELVFRLRQQGDQNIVRAVVSPRYAKFDNDEAFSTLVQSLPESAGSPVAFKTRDDGDNLRGSLLFPNLVRSIDGDSEYHVGLSFKNSETKRFGFEIQPFLFRSICLNGLIVGFEQDDRYRIFLRHVGEIDREMVRDQVIVAVEQAVEKSPLIMDLMGHASKIKVPNPQAAVAFLAKTNGVSPEIGRAWWAAYQEEPMENAAGIIHGLTRASQGYDDGTRQDLESLAGQLIAPSIEADLKQVSARWDAHVRGAKSFGLTYPEKVEKWTVTPEPKKGKREKVAA